MKKWIAMTGVVIALCGVTWWKWLDNNKGKVRDELMLNIPDTGQVNQIDILDRDGNRIKLVRGKVGWMVNDEPARAHAVDNLLTTLHDQRVSALIPKPALDNVVKDLGSNSVRIDVRGNNEKSLLIFYVGGVTPDERGTFMLREGSEWPVIVNIPGFEGALRSRYIMSLRDWKSRHIIRPVTHIQRLSVDYPSRQEQSFVMKNLNGEYLISPLYNNGLATLSVNKYIVEAYKDQLNNLYAEAVLGDRKMTALEAATPFCRVTLQDEKGGEQNIEFYPVAWIDYNDLPEKPEKIERYYTLYNGKVIFLTQHLLMQKIFTGYEHFVSLENFGKNK